MPSPISLRSLAPLILVALSGCSAPGCQRAAAAEGPPIVATGKLGDAPALSTARRTFLAADGSVVAIEKDAVASYDAKGTPRWKRPMRPSEWVVTLPDGSVMVNDREPNDVVALDPSTGADRWRVRIPTVPDGMAERAEAATRLGEGAMIGLEDARFFRVDPPRCAEPEKTGCLALAFALEDERLTVAYLAATASGDLLLRESGALRILSPTGEVRASIHVREGSPDVAMTESGRLAVTMDEELVLWDAKRCAGRSPVEIPRRPNKLYVKGEGECDGCRPPPPGCLVARPKLGDVRSAPVVLADGSVIVATDDEGVVKLAPDGATLWKKKVGVFGELHLAGGEVLALAEGEKEGTTRIVGIDPSKGDVRWSRALPAEVGTIIWGTDAVLDANGPWILAGYKSNVAWLRRP